jgi:hypothetical protein
MKKSNNYNENYNNKKNHTIYAFLKIIELYTHTHIEIQMRKPARTKRNESN